MPGPEPRLPPGFAATVRQVASYIGLALTVPAAALVGYGIGYVLDRQFATRPIFTIIFVVLGFAAGLMEVLRTIARD